MVNWHDPTLILNDYLALVKLSHAIAGVYIWEIVTTIGFELDVLRGKRPYRWTIWLYLGTRYTGLLGILFIFIVADSNNAKLDCYPVMMTGWISGYAALAFASLIIVIRVIAIWNRNIVVSLIAVGVWLGAVALNIRHLTLLELFYDPVLKFCSMSGTRRGLVNATGILVADVVLLLAMLIGLLRHPHKSSTGMWKFLYQQCIIWIALAMAAEIPLVVFPILNLNDPWNSMFTQPAATILSIGAARMYRTLSERGSLTECVSSDVPQLPSGSGNSIPLAWRGVPTMHSASASQSEVSRTSFGAPVFLPENEVHMGFVPGISTPCLPHESKKDWFAPNRYEPV